MTDYSRLTVSALRAECRRLGLPCYQSAGRRLRKADLVDAILAGGRKPKRRVARFVAPVIADDDRIVAKVASLTWCDHDYAVAMHRLMRGCDQVHERRLVDGRRLDAIRAIRDEHRVGSKQWLRWNDKHTEAYHFVLGGIN